MSDFCIAKTTSILATKTSMCLKIPLAAIIKEFVINKLVKLTML